MSDDKHRRTIELDADERALWRQAFVGSFIALQQVDADPSDEGSRLSMAGAITLADSLTTAYRAMRAAGRVGTHIPDAEGIAADVAEVTALRDEREKQRPSLAALMRSIR